MKTLEDFKEAARPLTYQEAKEFEKQGLGRRKMTANEILEIQKRVLDLVFPKEDWQVLPFLDCWNLFYFIFKITYKIPKMNLEQINLN